VLRLLRNYSPFTVLILVIAAFLMKLPALSHPVAPIPLPNHIVFASLLKLLNNILHGSASGYTFLAIIILVLEALYFNHITVKHKLFMTQTYLPAFTFLLLTSLYPAFNYFSEPLLINGLMLIAFDIMLSFAHSSQPRKQIFNAGFVVCLPALLQFPALAFFFLLLFALIFLRPFNIGEWVVGFMGYFTPIYFFAVILFLVDKLPVLYQIPRLSLSLPKHVENPLYVGGTIGGLVLLVILGSFALQQQMSRLTINIRRSWGLVYIFLVISLGFGLIAVSSVHAEWLVVMPSLSFLVAHSFYHEKTKRFSNFAFLFSLALFAFCQFSLYK
jgi:hypothetical protein